MLPYAEPLKGHVDLRSAPPRPVAPIRVAATSRSTYATISATAA